MRVYLAGPMTGLPAHNIPAFQAAAKDLRSRGFEVWSPATADLCDPNRRGRTASEFSAERGYAYFMARDLPALCRCDTLVVLPGWRRSPGARLEVRTAIVCGFPVLCYPSLKPERLGKKWAC